MDLTQFDHVPLKPKPGEQLCVWVLWHSYGDGSGSMIVRAYTDETRAMADYELMTCSPGTPASEWKLDQVQLYGSKL